MGILVLPTGPNVVLCVLGRAGWLLLDISSYAKVGINIYINMYALYCACKMPINPIISAKMCWLIFGYIYIQIMSHHSQKFYCIFLAIPKWYCFRSLGFSEPSEGSVASPTMAFSLRCRRVESLWFCTSILLSWMNYRHLYMRISIIGAFIILNITSGGGKCINLYNSS